MDEERREEERSEPAESVPEAASEERDASTERSESAMEEPTQPSVPTILKRPRVLALIGALVILVIVLITACGGGDDAADAGADPSTVDIVDTGEDLPPDPEPTPPPIEPEPPVEPQPPDTSELPITKVKGKALKRGMENKRVMSLQEGLIYLGYLEAGSADGQFGQKTKKAVQEFQLEQGLNGDGVAGQKTIRAINRAVKQAPAGGVTSTAGAGDETATDGDTETTSDGAESGAG